MKKLSKLVTVGLLSLGLVSALGLPDRNPNPNCSICQYCVELGIEIPRHHCDDLLNPNK